MVPFVVLIFTRYPCPLLSLLCAVIIINVLILLRYPIAARNPYPALSLQSLFPAILVLHYASVSLSRDIFVHFNHFNTLPHSNLLRGTVSKQLSSAIFVLSLYPALILSSVFIQRCLCPQSLSSAFFVLSLYPALSLSSVFIQRYLCPQSLSSAFFVLSLYPALSFSSVFIQRYLCHQSLSSAILVLSLYPALSFSSVFIQRYPFPHSLSSAILVLSLYQSLSHCRAIFVTRYPCSRIPRYPNPSLSPHFLFFYFQSYSFCRTFLYGLKIFNSNFSFVVKISYPTLS
jgi:hypothetical protein